MLWGDAAETHLNRVYTAESRTVDSNSRSTSWYDTITNSRGLKLENFIASKSLYILNQDDNLPTYETITGSSNIDLTISTGAMLNHLLKTSNDFEDQLEQIFECIQRSCDASIPKWKNNLKKHNGRLVTWWNDNLDSIRKRVNAKRKRYQRTYNDQQLRLERKREYYSLRLEYQNLLTKSKMESWITYCNTTRGSNPWNKVYKLASGKLKNGTILTTLQLENGQFTRDLGDSLENLMNKFIPVDSTNDDNNYDRRVRMAVLEEMNTKDDKLFSENEIYGTLNKINPNKTPGKDGLTSEILSKVNELYPTKTIAFADDFLIMIAGKDALELEAIGNEVLMKVEFWSKGNKILFNTKKSAALHLTRRRTNPAIKVYIYGSSIDVVAKFKYLGVTIDSKMTWNEHVDNVSKRGTQLVNILSKSAKVHWEIGSEALRVIYEAAFLPMVLYAISLWYEALELKYNRQKLCRAQRLIAIRIMKGYRTISYEAACVIANVIPICFKARALTLESYTRYNDELQRRNKWQRPAMSLKIGTIVSIEGDTSSLEIGKKSIQVLTKLFKLFTPVVKQNEDSEF
ncbi:hypothetical protein ILUMI_10962 [Ignelater luminosus]|uniref:Endonuclease/exonuclease/phosphatase domain-containing protein n=1 Tax=Ignelater luminosus TaxID=2038154 RepID=A0A8K0GEE4_IGNLU|nr:hypothetical protein ILUMI_10962 [Ignelater luminosus]